jgi:hypothetical protein
MDFIKDILPVLLPMGGPVVSIADNALKIAERLTRGKSAEEKAKIEREVYYELTQTCIKIGQQEGKDITVLLKLSNDLAESL